MGDIQEIDTVFQHVRHAAGRIRLPSDAAIAQQILLLGDSFMVIALLQWILGQSGQQPIKRSKFLIPMVASRNLSRHRQIQWN
jgi:hypothetical protein